MGNPYQKEYSSQSKTFQHFRCAKKSRRRLGRKSRRWRISDRILLLCQNPSEEEERSSSDGDDFRSDRDDDPVDGRRGGNGNGQLVTKPSDHRWIQQKDKEENSEIRWRVVKEGSGSWSGKLACLWRMKIHFLFLNSQDFFGKIHFIFLCKSILSFITIFVFRYKFLRKSKFIFT